MWSDTPCSIYNPNSADYARVTATRFGKPIYLRHVLVWVDFHGRLPLPGHEICHHCDTPACSELAHLFEATHSGNMHDMAAKGRHVSWNVGATHCKKGHEYTEVNTYRQILSSGRVKRSCKECRRARCYEWYHRDLEHARALARSSRGGKHVADQ